MIKLLSTLKLGIIGWKKVSILILLVAINVLGILYAALLIDLKAAALTLRSGSLTFVNKILIRSHKLSS